MLLDTFAWIEIFQSTSKGQKANELIRSRQCYTSAISLAEISAWVEKEKLDRTIQMNAVRQSTIILALDEALLEQGGILKTQKRKTIPDFGLIDAIILATAKQYQLPIVTGDAHFAGENVIFL